MNFNNRENPQHHLPDGRTIWESRACGVVANIQAMINDNLHILLVKRGPAVSHTNMWCMPCGYLDWDETIQHAVLRELFEETGLTPDWVPGPPYHVSSGFATENQVVTLFFKCKLRDEDSVKFKLPDMDEVLDIRWVPLDEIPLYPMAFNHNQYI